MTEDRERELLEHVPDRLLTKYTLTPNPIAGRQ